MDAVKEVLSPEDYKTVEKLINYVNEIQNIKSNPSDYDNFEFTIVKNADKKIGTANKSLKDYFNKAKIGVYGSTVEYLFKGAIKGIRPNDFDVRIFEDSTIQDKTQIARDLADILRQNGIDAKSEGSSVKVNGEKIFDIHMWDEKFNTTSLMPFDWKQKGYIDNNGVRVVPIEEQAAARVKSIFDKVEAEKTIGTEAGELGVLLPKQLDLPANQRRYENAKIVMRLSDLLAKSESYFRDKGKVSESENVAQILSTLEKQTKSSPILTEEEQKRMIEESFGSSEDFRDMFANAQIEALKYWEKGGKGDFVYKTELGELTIKPTPINKIIPGTLFTVVDNINSFIESIKLTGKVTSGKILEFENGKWIAKDKNIELYTSDELAYDYLVAKFGGADKIPPEAGIVMIRTSPNADIGVKDSGKLISTVKKIEYDTTSDGRKPVVLNELTVRTGGELYPTDKTSLSDKYDIPTGVLETKDPRTGRVYKIIGLATSSAKSEGKGYVPTASQLRTASWMALKGTFSDLLHPHKPSDIVFTDGTTAAKLQGSLFDLFYQDKAKFKIDEELLPDKTIRENVVKEDASWTRKAIDSLKKKLSEFDKDENGFLRLYGEEESNLIKKFKEAKDSTEYDSIVEKEKDNLRKKEIEDLINKNKETREYLDKVSPETKARVLAINLSDLVKPFMIISDSPIADIQEATNLTNLNTIGVSNVKTSSILPSLSVSIPEVSTVPSSEGISTLDVVTKTVIPSTIPSTKTTLTTPTIPTTPKIITVPTTPTTPTTPVIPTEPTIPTTPTTPTIPTIPTNGTPRISTDIIRKIPLSLDEKAKELESMGKLGRVTWQQGALKRGRYGELRKQWYVISYPFKTEKDIIRTFETPSGAVVVNSFGEAFKTIQQLTGSVPNFLLGIDFGAFDLFVSKPSKQGDKGALKFKRDIKQETRLPINVKQIKTIR